MLAFAHRFQAAIDGGAYRDRADVARRLGITRARVIFPHVVLDDRVAALEPVLGAQPVECPCICRGVSTETC